MTKKDPSFKRNLELFAQILDNYYVIRSRDFDDDPVYGDSFVFTFNYIETEVSETKDEDRPLRVAPIKAA